jgi:hypothetical protein
MELDGERICVVMVGRFGGDQWRDKHDSLFKHMVKARAACGFEDADLIHRRGRYYTLGGGVSFGGGQTMPGNLHNDPQRKAAFDELLQQVEVQDLAGFLTGASYSSYHCDRANVLCYRCIQNLVSASVRYVQK